MYTWCQGRATIDNRKRQDGQCTYNVALRLVHEAIFVVEKQKYYTFLCVRACVRVQGRGRVPARA